MSVLAGFLHKYHQQEILNKSFYNSKDVELRSIFEAVTPGGGLVNGSAAHKFVLLLVCYVPASDSTSSSFSLSSELQEGS
jgi:hypothetical protein